VASEAAQLNPWLSRANALACAALVVSIAYVLVKTVYLFLDDAAGSTAPVVYGSASQVTSSTGSAGRRVDAAALSLLHLFGEEGAKPVAQAAPQDVAAPKTRLSLELQGVFVSEEENKSTAMISEARRESQLYRIGDRVPGNATLAAVFADRVLLNLNGKLEALYFPESRMAGGMVPGAGGPGAMNLQGPRSVSARTGRVSAAPQPGMGVSGGAGVGGVGMPSPEAAEAVVNQLREEISANPDAVLGQFGLATNNGRGYKVTDSSNPALTAIGGRPGDVILTVNGRSVGDPAADVSLIQESLESGCVKVGVDRNGRQFNAEFCPGQ
jgi:general secretion pathway protein C